ncbi:MAG: hypothetical protein ACOC45_07440, partial [Alkalispirochaetaceae bacterium]
MTRFSHLAGIAALVILVGACATTPERVSEEPAREAVEVDASTILPAARPVESLPEAALPLPDPFRFDARKKARQPELKEPIRRAPTVSPGPTTPAAWSPEPSRIATPIIPPATP